MKLKVVIHEAEEGGYWGEVPAIPGCASQGETTGANGQSSRGSRGMFGRRHPAGQDVGSRLNHRTGDVRSIVEKKDVLFTL